jgi:hypothetical protein
MDTTLTSQKQSFHLFQKENIQSGIQSLVENIKVVLYQTDAQVFERLDFDDDRIYQEPLLFAYFKSNDRPVMSLDSILYGYYQAGNRPEKISVISDEHGRVYLPAIGWLITAHQNQPYSLTEQDGQLALYKGTEKMAHEFEPKELVGDTQIELIKYPVRILNQFYYDVDEKIVTVEIEAITMRHKENLVKALNLIRQYVPDHYELLSMATRAVVIFNVDSYLRNSFATLSAQGIGFFNAYQETYNEVFFVDDIAHQTGHVIFNTLIYDAGKFFRIDPGTIMHNVMVEGVIVEKRDIQVILHALYTYYTTFICLDACLSADVFEKTKRHEALGRIRFYIDKCHQDLALIQDPRKTFTDEGMIIYEQVRTTLGSTINKWGAQVKDFKLTNQPYNFTYSKFAELNTVS